MNSRIQAVFIGASAGGITTIQRLLGSLENTRQIPIIVVQHLPQYAVINLDLIFGQFAHGMKLVEVSDKTRIENGHVYFAPPGYHLLIEKDHSFSLSQDDPVNMARPSIDVIFESAANTYGDSACGILLTGANSDGAQGLKALHEVNAITMVQDPAEAEFSVMPQSAIDLFRPNYVCSIHMLSKILSELVRGETL